MCHNKRGYCLDVLLGNDSFFQTMKALSLIFGVSVHPVSIFKLFTGEFSSLFKLKI